MIHFWFWKLTNISFFYSPPISFFYSPHPVPSPSPLPELFFVQSVSFYILFTECPKINHVFTFNEITILLLHLHNYTIVLNLRLMNSNCFKPEGNFILFYRKYLFIKRPEPFSWKEPLFVTENLVFNGNPVCNREPCF